MREKISTEHSPGSWEEEINKYDRGEVVDIYARAGYPELIKREKEFAETMGVPDTALFNSGMAAIYTAVEAEELKPGDIILCGKDVYSQTKKIYENLDRRGIKVELIDSGNMEEIENMVKGKRPRLIILEDIANSSDMQVCDLRDLSRITMDANNEYRQDLNPEKLLEKYLANKNETMNFSDDLRREIAENISEFRMGGNPFIFRGALRKIEGETEMDRRESLRELSKIVKFVLNNSREKLSLIIDNTLASPALYNPTKDLDDGIEAVVVESGTKHYQEGGDKITMGISYSKNAEKMLAIKNKRTELGTYLQPNDEKEIPENIMEEMPNILKRHAENALALAQALNNSGKTIEVSHPNLPQHKQSDLAKKIAPEGLVTLFYLKVDSASEFVKRVSQLGGDKIGVGASFGHKKTWLLNLDDKSVRIAAGSESEEEFKKILEIFNNALEQ
ncbi:MAG: PLP-dependent transferase [Candidatus Moranbacteria bacterium]|nr:PLP-dependent transferase [Candidatus Moranbacteria bacterium]